MMRADLAVIAGWIAPGARVLDLGCGDGALLAHLAAARGVRGVGLEIDDRSIVRCIERGVAVVQTDLDRGLAAYFQDRAFDYVVMTQTLQAVRDPARLLDEMMRVGAEGIVTFANMGHWRRRLWLGAGRMPVAAPASWSDRANLHPCTIADFETLCAARGIRILRRVAMSAAHRRSWPARVAPNLFGEIALYRLTKGPAGA